ncbi:DUF7553 family protein [Haloferacaceae archaeon DSL9]
MAQHIESAREAIQRAGDSAEANVREQLLHVDEGLMELTEGDKTPSEAPPGGNNLEEIEAKLVGLADETEDAAARERLEAARDHLDAHRREHGLTGGNDA